MSQWVAKHPRFLHADSEDSDQSGRMPRLIFAGRTIIVLVVSCRGSFCKRVYESIECLHKCTNTNFTQHVMRLVQPPDWETIFQMRWLSTTSTTWVNVSKNICVHVTELRRINLVTSLNAMIRIETVHIITRPNLMRVTLDWRYQGSGMLGSQWL